MPACQLPKLSQTQFWQSLSVRQLVRSAGVLASGAWRPATRAQLFWLSPL